MLIFKSDAEINLWSKVYVATLSMPLDTKDRAKAADTAVELLRERVLGELMP